MPFSATFHAKLVGKPGPHVALNRHPINNRTPSERPKGFVHALELYEQQEEGANVVEKSVVPGMRPRVTHEYLKQLLGRINRVWHPACPVYRRCCSVVGPRWCGQEVHLGAAAIRSTPEKTRAGQGQGEDGEDQQLLEATVDGSGSSPACTPSSDGSESSLSSASSDYMPACVNMEGMATREWGSDDDDDDDDVNVILYAAIPQPQYYTVAHCNMPARPEYGSRRPRAKSMVVERCTASDRVVGVPE